MAVVCSSKSIASTSQTTRCHNPENYDMNLYCYKNLISHKPFAYVTNFSELTIKKKAYVPILLYTKFTTIYDMLGSVNSDVLKLQLH
jgi:hypothetical protein